MNILCSKEGIALSLEDYIDKMSTEAGSENLKPSDTPNPTNLNLHDLPSDGKYCDETEYRSLIGKFIYAANTARPDIAYATLYLSQFLIQPRVEHFQAAKKVLRYLLGTKYLGIQYQTGKDFTTLSDADFGSKLNGSEGKSRTGMIVLYAGSPVSWMSKKQAIVATSTVAELIALHEAGRETLWIQNLLWN